MSFHIESVVLGMVGTNCYLLINDGTKETVIFDPEMRESGWPLTSPGKI